MLFLICWREMQPRVFSVISHPFSVNSKYHFILYLWVCFSIRPDTYSSVRNGHIGMNENQLETAVGQRQNCVSFP